MPNIYEGNLVGTGLRIGVVVSRWNAFITERLLEGALDTLKRHGVAGEAIDIARVPGTFEVPLVAQRMAHSARYDAVVCLGCLIRGATPHFDYIASECSKGIAQAMMSSGVPISFGVLTTNSIEEAIERAGTKAGNKGAEAAGAAIEMGNLLRDLPAPIVAPGGLPRLAGYSAAAISATGTAAMSASENGGGHGGVGNVKEA